MTVNITFPYKDKTGENTVIEDAEDEVDELPYSDVSKSAAILFDEILMVRIVSFHSQILVDLIENLGRVFIVRS